jgi:AcrR family transcriptional regulator
MPKVPERYFEERRTSIVQAASRIFERKGVQATTMADIALEAGITPGAIYRYFDGKNDLAMRCFRANAAAVAQLWAHPTAPGMKALEDLGRLATITFGLLADPHATNATVLYLENLLERFRAGGPPADLAEQHEQAVVAIERRLETARFDGELRSDANVRNLAEALVAFYWGARIDRLVNPKADSEGMLVEILNLLGSHSP